jgi:protein-L-isoaspartate(D-aspartate) O-methyltransferase
MAPETPADGVYVNFAVSRPADRWVDGLSPGGRLVFPLGVPGPQRPNSGGRHSDRGAALRIERRGDAYAARGISTAYFVSPKEGSRPMPKSLSDCAPPSTPAASTRSAA